MSLPNLSRTVSRFGQPVEIISVTIVTKDFDPVILSRVSRKVKAVVQVARKESLNPDIVNWSLRYLMIHCISDIYMNEYIFYQDNYYKVVDINNYQDYGYTEITAEEVKDRGGAGL